MLKDKVHVSKSINDTYKVTSISKSSGDVSYDTTTMERGFLRNELFKQSNTYYNNVYQIEYQRRTFMAESAVSQ